jgi:hypothetical protein
LRRVHPCLAGEVDPALFSRRRTGCATDPALKTPAIGCSVVDLWFPNRVTTCSVVDFFLPTRVRSRCASDSEIPNRLPSGCAVEFFFPNRSLF